MAIPTISPVPMKDWTMPPPGSPGTAGSLVKKSRLIAEAPLVGHGTGTTPLLFRADASAQENPQIVTGNPHNQALAIAIELGLFGVLVLVAMWISHLAFSPLAGADWPPFSGHR